jgi:hypothetical protein
MQTSGSYPWWPALCKATRPCAPRVLESRLSSRLFANGLALDSGAQGQRSRTCARTGRSLGSPLPGVHAVAADGRGRARTRCGEGGRGPRRHDVTPARAAGVRRARP